MKRIYPIILASRPKAWAYTGLLFLLGAFIARKAGYHLPPYFILYVLWFFVGANLYGMLLNDYFDRELDGQNPRKKHRTLPPSDYALGIGFSLVSFALLQSFFPNPYLLFCVAVPIAVNLAYSAPPMRLKEHPPLDLLVGPANGLGCILAGYYAASPPTWPDVTAIAVGFLFFCSTELAFQSLDIEADTLGGIRTSATALGRRGALIASACFMLAAAGLLGSRNLLHGLGILPFVAVVAGMRNAATDAKRRRFDRRLPLYYAAAGVPLALLYWFA